VIAAESGTEITAKIPAESETPPGVPAASFVRGARVVVAEGFSERRSGFVEWT
jgi:hypothetical protein